MTLLEALDLRPPEVVAVVGAGGKTAVAERLATEAYEAGLRPGEDLLVVDGERPASTTLVLAVAGLDTLEASTEQTVASNLVELGRGAPRAIYVLNKADDEMRLQQGHQIAARLEGKTLITVEGFLVWPQEP